MNFSVANASKTDNPASNTGMAPVPDSGAADAPEITLDEALKDPNVKVLVPTCLPSNAKLDIERRATEGYYTIRQYYNLGDEWIEVAAIAKPRPTYEKDVLVTTKAERVRPDGTKEPVTINSGVVVAEPRPDGSIEPRGVDKSWLVTVKGVTGKCTESTGVGTVRADRNPRPVAPRNFAGLQFWKDGVEYEIMGSNMSLAEVMKIAESMF